jgi:hypothetical protein
MSTIVIAYYYAGDVLGTNRYYLLIIVKVMPRAKAP